MRNITFTFPGLPWFWGVPVIVFLDQITKWWILHHVALSESIPVFPGFSITLAYNRGIAFSLLKNQPALGRWLLVIGIICISAILAKWLAKTPISEKWSGSALLCILGGAIGNLIDRFIHGHVIDFIDVYVKNWHFYTFNVADSFITVGAIILLGSIIFE